MLPWGHLAVGYLAVGGTTHLRRGRAPTYGATWTVVVASQLPDLVDKPLAWTLDVLPGGRTLAHSAAFGVVVLVAAWWLARSGRGHIAEALAVGHASHLVADVPPRALLGDISGLAYLGWPLTTMADYPDPPGILPYLVDASTEPDAIAQVGLLAVAVAVWWRDGRPGLSRTDPP
ncbi:MAG: metal-dependent hydrolase [Halobacteriales archaeon]